MAGYPSEDFASMGYSSEDFSTVGAGPMYPLARPYIAPQMLQAPRPMAPSPAMMQQYARQAAPFVRQAMAAQGGVSEPRVRQIVQEMFQQQIPAWFEQQQQVPGSPSEGELMSPLGLGMGTLTAANAVVQLEAEPQRPFRGERLIVSLFKSAGALQVPVNVSNFSIGENSQLVGRGLLPAESFAPDSFGIRLAMTPAAPGIIISVRFEPGVAVPAGESIVIVASIIGRAAWGPRG